MGWWILLGALSIGAVPLRGLAQVPAPPPAAEQPGPPPAERTEPAPTNPPPGSPRPPAADEGFVPSEELGADEEVTFPIDI
jgi:hypothetical protein